MDGGHELCSGSGYGVHQMLFPMHPAFGRPPKIQRKESPVFDKCQSGNWFSTRDKTAGTKTAVQSISRGYLTSIWRK